MLNSFESVPGIFVRFEEDTVIEKRRIRNKRVVFEIPGILVNLQVSAPTLFPFLIQVDDGVAPAMISRSRMQIEVNMDVQALTRQILVRSRTMILGLIEETFDACQTSHLQSEFGR